MLPIHTRFLRSLASATIALLISHAALAQDGTLVEAKNPESLPEIKIKTVSGAIEPLPKATSKLTVLHFWATWCTPCLAELPELLKTQEKYKDKGLTVITISMDGDNNLPKVRTYLEEKGLSGLTPYLDSGNSAFGKLKLRGLPTTIFLNGKNESIAAAEGPLDWNSDRARAFIEFHLK